MTAHDTGRSRRRSVRVDLQVPVVIRWVGRDGSPRVKQAKTIVVNEHGCLLPLSVAMVEGTSLELENRSSKQVRAGKVIWCGLPSRQGTHQVGIELAEPDPQFWGPEYAGAIRRQTLTDIWIG